MDEVHRDRILPAEVKPAGGAGSLIGARFGPFVVVAFVGGMGHRRAVRVRCDCGRTRTMRVRKLAHGAQMCTCTSSRACITSGPLPELSRSIVLKAATS